METFYVSLFALSLANSKAVAEAERRDPEIIDRYAALPAESAPPILLLGKKIADGLHRTAAALRRNDEVILAARSYRSEQWGSAEDRARIQIEVQQLIAPTPGNIPR